MKSIHLLRLAAIRRFLWKNWGYALILGAIPAFFVILFLPLDFQEYTIDLSMNSMDRYYWFEDMDDDGHKEKFAIGSNKDASMYLYLHTRENQVQGQYNFEHAIPSTWGLWMPEAWDIDRDGTRELILFSQKRDSLFLNIFDYVKMEISLESRFITCIGGLNDKLDYRIYFFGGYDVDGDARDELYFSVSGTFALTPRKVFRYDCARDSLISSINTGSSTLRGDMGLVDGKFHLFVSGQASGNIEDPGNIPYPDTCCWLFGLDADLEFLMEPLPFGRYPSGISQPRISQNHVYFLQAPSGGSPSHIYKAALDGKLLDSIRVEVDLKHYIRELYQGKDTIWVIGDYGVNDSYILSLDPFELLPGENLSLPEHREIQYLMDPDQDGRYDMIFRDRHDYFFYFYPDGNFKKGIPINLHPLNTNIISASYFPESGIGEISIVKETGSEIYEYYRNPRYKLRLVVWALIYLLSVIFVSMVMYLQRRRILREHQLKQQVADLQLQNLRNQLDPHFTFNALNTVGNAIYQENKEKAYDLFHRFTRIIRSSLMVSDQVFRTIEEEVQFTEDYLEFQKTRFRGLFEYSCRIEQGAELEKAEIPKMLIQGFAENAVKHAFYKVDYVGQIHIVVRKEPRAISISIVDNGIGISRSRKLQATSGTQIGEKLLLEQVKQINQLYEKGITVEIKDRTDSGEENTGTRVEIHLPNK